MLPEGKDQLLLQLLSPSRAAHGPSSLHPLWLMESWERRDQDRSTPEPFGGPEQGQEVTDVGPHLEFP